MGKKRGGGKRLGRVTKSSPKLLAGREVRSVNISTSGVRATLSKSGSVWHPSLTGKRNANHWSTYMLLDPRKNKKGGGLGKEKEAEGVQRRGSEIIERTSLHVPGVWQRDFGLHCSGGGINSKTDLMDN